MKKILYIHQYFQTPNEPGGTRSYWIAKKLIEKNYKVTMLTTSSSIEEPIKRCNIDGIDVIYLKIPYNNEMGFLKRIIIFLKFMFKSTIIALKEKNISLVIATSTPLTVGFPALILKKIKRKKYIFEVRDLWPEVPVQMGIIKNKIIIALLNYLEKIIYKNATSIIALSPGMQKGILEKKPSSKVHMIPNMAKIDIFYPREKNISLIHELGLKENSFKLIYFGAMGIANGIDNLMESINLMKNHDDIEFVFIGSGKTRSELIEYCNQNKINNAKFLDSYPLSLLSEIVNFCDVSLVYFKNTPILYTNSPNKLFDSLSAGKPIIVNSAGWTKNLVEENNCGLYVNPDNPQDFVNKILYIKNNKDILINMGKNSRLLAETKYDKSILCESFYNVINNINV